MLRIYTAQYRYSGLDRLDITVKGGDPIGKLFAPSWPMVMAFKNGTMTKAQYKKQYEDMMMLSLFNNRTVWDTIYERGDVTFVCFCPSGSFCHRYLLKDMFMKIYPDCLYGGEK